ncbi:MAG: hypothetical protein E4H28_04985 [Gemmatimonadales bacterium]|nr:MAG: hypothetical protein E4H28_04985 [Gemmatimonadales bacterium]
MDKRKEDQVLKGWGIMWWREMKELAGMVLLLGILVATGLSVSTAANASELAEVREVPSVEQPVESEIFQAFDSTEPVGSPDCA